MSNELESMQYKSVLQGLKGYLLSQIFGQEKFVDCLLIVLLVDGYLLVEGVLGLVKIKVIKDFVEGFEVEFYCIQFIFDLFFVDIIGIEIYCLEIGIFVFQ